MDIKKQIKILKIINIILLICIAFTIYLMAVEYYEYQQEKPPDIFRGFFNVTKTPDGWIIKGYAYILKPNSTGAYSYIDRKVELSHLRYDVDNNSNDYVYESGYISSIVNKPSPLGIVFYDVDNNGLLSKGDYMFIPRKGNSTNYPHSGDKVIFMYDGCDGAFVVGLP